MTTRRASLPCLGLMLAMVAVPGSALLAQAKTPTIDGYDPVVFHREAADAAETSHQFRLGRQALPVLEHQETGIKFRYFEMNTPCVKHACKMEIWLSGSRQSAARWHRLRSVTSLAFGGADLRTVYMGCLGGASLATFRSSVARVQPVHWNWS